jgi:hypothetical protein
MTIDPFTWFTIKCVAFGLLCLVVLFLSVYGVLKQLGIGTKPKGQIGTVVEPQESQIAQAVKGAIRFRVESYPDKGLDAQSRQLFIEAGYGFDGSTWRRSK